MEPKAAQRRSSPFLIFYAAVYVLFLFLMRRFERFDITEALQIVFVVGIGFSVLSWGFTWKARPLAFHVKHPKSEGLALCAYFLGIIVFITWGMNVALPEPQRSILILLLKLLLFVVLPGLGLLGIWKYPLRAVVTLDGWQRHWIAALGMSLVLFCFQAVFGQGWAMLRQVKPSVLVFGVPFAYLLLLLEVGLVEEFFFRVLVQSRLAALLRSEAGGIVMMSLLFGLAHAPGLYLRAARTQEAVGTAPSLLLAVGYSIVITSVAGFFLGILWSRTRNLLLVMIVHASGDLLPNTLSILQAWHWIGRN